MKLVYNPARRLGYSEQIVSDAHPQMCLDPDPRVSEADRYAAMTVTAIHPAEEADRVGPGSSGGPVFNDAGELIGLIWTGADWTEEDLADGIAEVWITPVSAWLPRLQAAAASNRDLQAVLDATCDD